MPEGFSLDDLAIVVMGAGIVVALRRTRQLEERLGELEPKMEKADG